MTDRTDVARGRDIVARWCGLAEQRLDHLTEMFESGRWRRYYSEIDFLENIREAKAAVEAWRGMLSADSAQGNRPLDLSWIGGRGSALIMKRQAPTESAPAAMLEAAALPLTPAASVVPDVAGPEPELIAPSETAGLPAETVLDKTLALTLDIVAQTERYPLLPNAFRQ